MITNISPAWSSFEDTRNTLKYADRAKQIKTIVKRNVLNVDFHIENYGKIIGKLRGEIENLREQLSVKNGPTAFPENA
jgi:kinesin family protein 18/19